MNISMWILYDELKEFDIIPLIYDGTDTFSSFRTFSSFNSLDLSKEELFNTDFVYVGILNDFFADQRDRVFLVNRNDMLILENMSFPDVINHLVAILDKYSKYSNALHNALLQDNPFQSLLDAAHTIFQCPLLFGHKSLRIYAITQQYHDADVFSGWDNIKDSMSVTPWLMKNQYGLLPANEIDYYPDNLDPVAIPAAHTEISGIPSPITFQIRTIIHYKGEIWGHFYIYYYKKTVSPSVLQLARYVGDLYEYLITHTVASGYNSFEKYSFLIEYLAGIDVSPDALSTIQYNRGYQDNEKLILYHLKIKEDSGTQFLLNYILRILNEQFPSEIVFPFQKDIIVIARESADNASSLSLSLSNKIDKNQCFCGVSFPFDGLENSRQAFFQSNFALDNSIPVDGWYYFFKDVAFSGMVSYIRNSCNWHPFVPPELFSLVEHDKNHGTEYVKTLRFLLINYGHLQETASQLFIHRNTLKYRIEQIRKISGIDAQNESSAAFLRYCFALLEPELHKLFPQD